MSCLRNGSSTSKEDDKDLDRILDSSACRKLFTWAKPKEAMEDFDEKDSELKEQQRLRWNFDFETETPLPGRYQWVRTRSASNGHHKNGDAEEKTKVLNKEVERRSTRPKLNAPYSRKSRTESPGSNTETAGSCDSPLNELRRSERKSHTQLSNSQNRLNPD